MHRRIGLEPEVELKQTTVHLLEQTLRVPLNLPHALLVAIDFDQAALELPEDALSLAVRGLDNPLGLTTVQKYRRHDWHGYRHQGCDCFHQYHFSFYFYLRKKTLSPPSLCAETTYKTEIFGGIL
jgi:hypothetical protein